MKQSFENKLQQKASNLKIKPSDKLTQDILSDINKFSAKTKLIRSLKILSTVIVSATVLTFIFTQQTPDNNKIAKTIKKETVQQNITHPNSRSENKQQQETKIIREHKNQPSVIAKQITNTKNNDTIICKEEITLPKNNGKWTSNMDNIIIDNSKSNKSHIFFAKPGIYKLYEVDTDNNINDSSIILAIFAYPNQITTCNKNFVLPHNITTVDKQKTIEKNSLKEQILPVLVSLYGHTTTDTISIVFNEKPQIDYTISKTSNGKYDIIFNLPEGVKITYNNREISKLSGVESGEYTFTAISNNGCDTTFTIKTDKSQLLDPDFEYVNLDNRPGIPIYFKDKSIIYGYKTVNYNWNFGDGTNSTEKNPQHIYKEAGRYKVELTVIAEDGTTKSATKLIIILPPKENTQPNVFTPNNDGKNDVFKVDLPIQINNFKCEIFTRNGKKIYEFNDINSGWDGRIKGQPASEGIYYYIITGTKQDGSKYIEKSFIYLYR